MRYLPLTNEERKRILDLCGVERFEDLIADVPKELQLKGHLDVAPALSEPELVDHLGDLARRNAGARMTCHLGQGVYDHLWPTVIDQITNRGEFLTAYTPYQPEISQGTLQVIFEYQSMVADLMGMEVANASLYDGPTSVVEGVLMSARLGGHKSGVVYVNEGAYDRVFDVLETYLKPLGYQVKTWYADPKSFLSTANSPCDPSEGGEPVVAVVTQSPNRWGLIEDWEETQKLAKAHGARSIAYVAHAVAPAFYQAPGEAGLDIAVGEGQALGIPMGFGGPYLGLFACRMADVRQMPGRLVGATEDARGQRAFCITLSTREQHIRRDKATSNICSNQNLMAVRAALYMTLMGPQGLRRVAESCRIHAGLAAELFHKRVQRRLPELQLLEGDSLAEVTVLVPPKRALWLDEVRARADAAGILAGTRVAVPRSSGFVGALVSAFTERHTHKDIERWSAVLAGDEGGLQK